MNLSDLSEEQLYVKIGESIGRYSFGANEEEEYKRLGKFWYEFNKERLKKLICESEKIYKVATNLERNDEEKLAFSICELLSIAFVGIPVVFVAYLLIRIGLKNFCNW